MDAKMDKNWEEYLNQEIRFPEKTIHQVVEGTFPLRHSRIQGPMLFIIGPGGSGKSSLAKIISRICATRLGPHYIRSTSSYATEVMWHEISTGKYTGKREHARSNLRKYDIRSTDFKDIYSFYNTRSALRLFFAEWIKEFNFAEGYEGDRLYRMAYADGNHILDGIRKRTEFNQCQHTFPNHLVIWIHKETVGLDPTLQLNPDDADIIIENNGTLAELMLKCYRIFHQLLLMKENSFGKPKTRTESTEIRGEGTGVGGDGEGEKSDCLRDGGVAPEIGGA